MKVKIDTKEKFHVLDLQEPVLTANMTAELSRELLQYVQKDIRNVVLNLAGVKETDEMAARCLAGIQQRYYDNNASFVICGMSPTVERFLDSIGLLEIMNVVPTQSEAWDIVQMEEIERELAEE